MQPSNIDIAELTRRMRSGDESAYRSFYDHYAPQLLRYLVTLHQGDIDSAKDSLQATFLRIAKNIRIFEDNAVFTGWIHRLAKTAFIDATRKESRYRKFMRRFVSESELATAKKDTEPNLFDKINAALGSVAPEARELVEAHYFQKLSHAEIGERHGISPRAVEGRLARIRAKLKRDLERAESDD